MARSNSKNMAKKGKKCWKTNSKDGKKLKSLLLSGKISKGASPKYIMEMFPEFQCYKGDSFRAALRRLKTSTGFNVRKDGDGSGEC
jgi:hypothetical protein